MVETKGVQLRGRDANLFWNHLPAAEHAGRQAEVAAYMGGLRLRPRKTVVVARIPDMLQAGDLPAQVRKVALVCRAGDLHGKEDGGMQRLLSRVIVEPLPGAGQWLFEYNTIASSRLDYLSTEPQRTEDDFGPDITPSIVAMPELRTALKLFCLRAAVGKWQ
ncbi:MAG: hypothetical protein WC901_01485 [Candidatus Margulisiibacteriota bacterium]